MFKKRKEKKAQERNAARNEAENRFLLALKEAEQVKDPAEKIMELMSLNAAIRNHLDAQKNGISNEAWSAGKKAWWSTYGTGAAATAASFPLTGPVGLAASGVGLALYGGAYVVDAMRKKSVMKNLQAAAADHTEEMEALQKRIWSLIDETVESNVSAIAASQYREHLLLQPRISDVFAAASARHVAENERLVEEARKILADKRAVKGVEPKEEPRLTKKPTPRLIKPN